jgi:hypothetical protein
MAVGFSQGKTLGVSVADVGSWGGAGSVSGAAIALALNCSKASKWLAQCGQ